MTMRLHLQATQIKARIDEIDMIEIDEPGPRGVTTHSKAGLAVPLGVPPGR